MTPGPTEPTADNLQNILKFIVDDLLMLWKDGKEYQLGSRRTSLFMQPFIYSTTEQAVACRLFYWL